MLTNKCSYTAAFEISLIQHKENVHERKRFPCSICDYTASSKGTLKRHIETFHYGIQYLCDHRATFLQLPQNI